MMRRGFTLFEVVVALGLSVALMAMIGTAMNFYMSQLNVRDTEARRTHLARSILQLIAEDLRSCIYPAEFDGEELATVLSAASGNESGGGGGESTASTDDLTIDETSEEDTSTLSDTDLSSSLMTTLRPGLIGNQFQIQFDVSRLPRLEEYLPMMADPNELGIQDIPSDVKTVSYFVQQPNLANAQDSVDKLAGGGIDETPSAGLVRRALSREITGFATNSGDVSRLTQTGDLLASEVVAIEFAYFDGTQWIFEWDSDELGSLPIAIQVRLTLSRSGSANDDDAIGLLSEEGGFGTDVDVYDMTVRLPMAPLVTSEETEEDLSAAGI